MLWVFFIVLSYQQARDVGVKGEQLDGAKNDSNKDAWFVQVNDGSSTLCATISVMAGGGGGLRDALLYRVSDGRRAVRSVVTTRGDLLVDCAFVQACRRAKRQVVVAVPPSHSDPPHTTGGPRRLAATAADSRFVRLDGAVATCREFERRTESRVVARMEQPQPQPEPQPQTQPPATSLLRRSKRGLTYPGTLWCGAGNMADSENDLGKVVYFLVVYRHVTGRKVQVIDLMKPSSPPSHRGVRGDGQLLPDARPLPARHPRLLLQIRLHQLQVALHLPL